MKNLLPRVPQLTGGLRRSPVAPVSRGVSTSFLIAVTPYITTGSAGLLEQGTGCGYGRRDVDIFAADLYSVNICIYKWRQS